jgi:hypothetical protein
LCHAFAFRFLRETDIRLGEMMFLGVYKVAVAADGTIVLPRPVAAALAQHDLIFEPLAQERGQVILARPGVGEPALACANGAIHLPPALLAEAEIGDTAELRGMGEYLIICKGG